jgi:lipoprotein-anchoring transpeptidase ErfK/SrfK
MKHIREPGQHRAQQPGRRRAEPPGRRRADVRPRYGRIAILGAAAAVTGIAVLGGFGLIPSGPEGASAASGSITPSGANDRPVRGGDNDSDHDSDGRQASVGRQATVVRTEPVQPQQPQQTDQTGGAPALPVDSGTGRRIVFSESEQRVWLVSDAGDVLRSYLVSGSATDNLDPGTYQVFSKSRYAVGVDDSGTMEYFIRFTHGDAGAAIGFHTIPVDDGAPIQTTAQLGTPLSHGCVRQRTTDAVALWDFAPIGTTVVVTG